MTLRSPGDEPSAEFNARTIGPEPTGATPLSDEELHGLIPDFVATRADLHGVEFENIANALSWARLQAQSLGPHGVFDYGFMLALHRRMFGDVWRWAGTLGRRVTHVGVEPHLIATQSRLALDDATFWHTGSVFEADELAARIHSRLFTLHPFPNGNGRCTRLVADLYLVSIGASPFTWGGSTLGADGSTRAMYLAALVGAVEHDDYAGLVRFARGTEG